MVEKARLALNDGRAFGQEDGEGYMRTTASMARTMAPFFSRELPFLFFAISKSSSFFCSAARLHSSSEQLLQPGGCGSRFPAWRGMAHPASGPSGIERPLWVAVDLVADNQGAILHAKFAHPAQLLLAPHLPYRVVRMAEEQRPDALREQTYPDCLTGREDRGKHDHLHFCNQDLQSGGTPGGDHHLPR